jgi:hypothetical protein
LSRSLKQLVLEPLLLGLLIGGIPFAVVFSTLVGKVVSATTFGYMALLTPVGIAVASWSALRGGTSSRGSVFVRAMFSSLGACVPLPTVVCAALIFHDMGSEGFFNPRNVPVFAFLFTLWAGLTAFFASAFALAWLVVKNRRRQLPAKV